jgi:GNAT superfamily N-acetyltransferase
MIANEHIQESDDTFTIEDAHPEDVETLRHIVRDAWLRLYPNTEFGITKEDIEAIDWLEPVGIERRRREITDMADTIRTWVLKDTDGGIVGFCKASRSEDGGEVEAIYVREGYEGKGLGKKLLLNALEWLPNDKPIKLYVVAYNTHAIGFYKKFGFVETDHTVAYEGTKLPSGKTVPRIEMVRSAYVV